MLILTITITDGPLKGQVFVFDEPGVVKFGRNASCDVCLTNQDLSASRQHFELQVVGRRVLVRDVGSLWGTWVNGVLIGKRNTNRGVEEAEFQDFCQVELNDGDEIRAGKHIMQVKIEKASEVDPRFATSVLDGVEHDPQKALQEMIEELGFSAGENAHQHQIRHPRLRRAVNSRHLLPHPDGTIPTPTTTRRRLC